MNYNNCDNVSMCLQKLHDLVLSESQPGAVCAPDVLLNCTSNDSEGVQSAPELNSREWQIQAKKSDEARQLKRIKGCKELSKVDQKRKASLGEDIAKKRIRQFYDENLQDEHSLLIKQKEDEGIFDVGYDADNEFDID